MIFKMDLVLDGLWKSLQEGLQKVLGSLGGVLGGSMFQIPFKKQIATQSVQKYRKDCSFLVTFEAQLGSPSLILDIKM